MKYLKKFATEADVLMADTPNVVLAEDTKKVLYNIKSNGAYIQHIDGNLYTKAAWVKGGFAKAQANGVAVISDKASFVIALSFITEQKAWSSDSISLVDGILTTEDSSKAQTDYNGKDNTDKIVLTDISEAAYCCANYIFPNGKKGYLPSLGELALAYNYKDKIDEALLAIGVQSSDRLSGNYIWSSTQYSADKAWYIYWAIGQIIKFSKTTLRMVRPFTTL